MGQLAVGVSITRIAADTVEGVVAIVVKFSVEERLEQTEQLGRLAATVDQRAMIFSDDVCYLRER